RRLIGGAKARRILGGSAANDGASITGAGMKHRSRAGIAVLAGLLLTVGIGFPAHSQTPSRTPSAGGKVASMAGRAQGTFDVKLTPQATDEKSESPALGRMSIEKQFHGDLEGSSRGEMLTAGTGVKGSAGYVAWNASREP